MKPILQITLNFLEPDIAERAGKNAAINAEWIGVGNSLIKSEGVRAIKRIKEEFLDKKIVADMMVMDSPEEIEIASRAGADIVTVSGKADSNILLACVNVSRINGIEIAADLRNINSIKEKAELLEKLGFNYILLNCDDIGEIYNSVQIPIIAECSMDIETIGYAVESGAGIVALRLNNEDDLRRLARIKGAIRDREFSLFTYPKDIPTREEFDGIKREIDSIKNMLAGLETRIEHDRKDGKELRRIDAEWEKIKKAEKIIENQKKRIADEMRRIEQEWREIEKVTGDMEKKDRITEDRKNPRKEELKVMDRTPIIEVGMAGTHTEKNIEGDLIRIKEEHKKRRDELSALIHRTS